MRKLDFSPRWDATNGYKNLKQRDLKIFPRQDKKVNFEMRLLNISPYKIWYKMRQDGTSQNKTKVWYAEA